MAAITWADVTSVATELADPAVPVAAQTLYLEHANAHFDADVMGGEASANLKLARIYLAAHSATMARYAESGTAGPISEVKLGDETIRYGGTSQSADTEADPFTATPWGRLLNDLVCATPLARLPVLL